MKPYLILLLVLCLAVLVACTDGGEPSEADTVEKKTSEVTAPATGESAAPATDPITEALTEAPTEPETPAETEEETVVTYKNLQNPIVSSANDPWVVEHEGRYYYCRSFWYFAFGIIVTEIPSPDALTNEGGEVVFIAPEGTAYSAEYWAPELHYINGEWYIYVAADDGNNETHRMYVLKGTSQDPTKPFEFVGQVTDPSNKWAIDGTVMEHKGELYFVWSGWKGNTNVAQDIYIAHMSDPCTIDSERVVLSRPTHDWERVGQPYVNEGPTALYHGDDTFIVYSASGSWTDAYCLGLLTLVGDDPMDPMAWKKSAEPVFKAKEGVAYGPGHCSFTTAADGSIWMLYHANLESGTGWDGRSGWIAPVTFSEDGTPVFGEPEKNLKFPVKVEKKP